MNLNHVISGDYCWLVLILTFSIDHCPRHLNKNLGSATDCHHHFYVQNRMGQKIKENYKSCHWIKASVLLICKDSWFVRKKAWRVGSKCNLFTLLPSKGKKERKKKKKKTIWYNLAPLTLVLFCEITNFGDPSSWSIQI